MPAINTGISRRGCHEDNVAYDKPDFCVLKYSQTIDDWRKVFGHVGPKWFSADNAAKRAPNDPA